MWRSLWLDWLDWLDWLAGIERVDPERPSGRPGRVTVMSATLATDDAALKHLFERHADRLWISVRPGW
jgi:hypothetical protein